MNKRPNIKLTSVDDLFVTDEIREAEVSESLLKSATLTDITEFPNHPFKVLHDEAMMEMADSIKRYGISDPILVREKNGGYELIAGHRRKTACEIAGKTKVPAIVRNMSDDEAVIAMVDSNCQRETLLPSEKAKAYKLSWMQSKGRANARI